MGTPTKPATVTGNKQHTMKAWWHEYDRHNFGDWITPYIIQKITGIMPTHSNTGKHYMLVGSILQDANNNTIVLGAGFGARDQMCTGRPKLHIVRGHITGEMLTKAGYPTTWIYGDPAITLPLLYQPKTTKLYKHGFVPHYVDYPLFKDLHEPNTIVIDITMPVEQVITQMAMCASLETSSLHGLIVGEAYGIPTTLKKYSNKIAGDGMKYDDYRTSPASARQVLALIKHHILGK